MVRKYRWLWLAFVPLATIKPVLATFETMRDCVTATTTAKSYFGKVCAVPSLLFSPSRWEKPSKEVWVPWSIVMALCLSEASADRIAENFHLVSLRNFIQKRIIPNVVLDTPAGQLIAKALFLVAVMKLIDMRWHFNLMPQKDGEYKLNFNSIFPLLGMSYAVGKLGTIIFSRPEESCY